MKVFISYAIEDIEIAKKLGNDLEKAGIKTWLERECLLVGENWRDVVTKQIRESRYFIVLISSKSVLKQNIFETEPNCALDLLSDEQLFSDRISILPVRIDDCQITHEKLERLQSADLFPSYEKGLNDLLKVLLPNKPQNKHPVSNEIQNDSNGQNRFTAQIPNEIPEKHPAPNLKWLGYAAICLLALGWIYYAAKPAPLKRTYHLRKHPITVSEDEAVKTFRLKKDSDGWYRPLEYVENDFKDNKDGTITDRATGLMWQRSGSDNFMKYEDADAYIREINRTQFAGYSDWRLPTVDEMVSLLTPSKQSQGLYINPIFADTQSWCWTSDKRKFGGAWHIYFLFGSLDWYNLNVNYFVRAVRSLPSDPHE